MRSFVLFHNVKLFIHLNILALLISTVLNGCNAGCYVGHTCLNTIMYADDLVVFCPPSRGLQT